jgi:BirA family biotin operon repressor/biotin-[acetyl-CoA-carboxylase] ligase
LVAEAALPNGSGAAGWRLLELDAVGSTNDEAAARAAAGEGPGLAILARTQNAGRGRRGRTWISPEGNLHLSLLVDPGRPMPEAAQLSFVAALALAEALPIPAECKWPNDVLVGGKKIAGLLLEGAGTGLVIVGIGVNLADHPPESLVPATSLAAQGVTIAPCAFLIPLLERFDFWRRLWAEQGFAAIRAPWLARARGLGGKIVARLPNEELEGTFQGLDQDGALLLATGGELRRVLAADIFFER